MRFGVELECRSKKSISEVHALLQNEGLRRWQAKYDGSIHTNLAYQHQVEVISPPLEFNSASDKEELKKVLSLLREFAEVNVSCGTHVHVDGTNLTWKNLQSLTRVYTRWEPVLLNLVSKSRKESTFCKPWSGLPPYEIDPDKMTKATSKPAFLRAWAPSSSLNSSRYRFLNFRSWITKGTVEFRGHQGTLNYTKLIRWVEICIRMVERSVERNWGYAKKAKMSQVAAKMELTPSYKKAQVKLFCERLELSSTIATYVKKKVA